MKFKFIQTGQLLAVVSSVLFSVSVSAIPLATVGGLDTLHSQATISPGKASEEAWISGIVGYAVELDYKLDNADLSWESVDGTADWFAQLLTSTPDWYLIKLGTGNSGADTHYLYQNNDELGYAVIDFSILDAASTGLNFNIGRISHLSVADSDDVILPEPSVGALLLLGAAGLFAQRTLNKKS